MNKTKVVCLMLLLVMIAAPPTGAQKKTIMKIEGENIFLFQELLLVLSEEEGRVVVNMAPPDGALPQEHKDLDLRAKDKVLMMNGKRIKSTAEIKQIYEKLKPGDEIKLGVKRGEEMFIVTFEKEDLENGPVRKVIRREVKTEDKESEPEEE
ncbi:MAG: PDZ domain-containing protein [Candidatus Krumholzibacteriota bacterium]|nr:PDZ domain-containing protein [Candidatus Krumholzibacteriota bacterium]